MIMTIGYYAEICGAHIRVETLLNKTIYRPHIIYNIIFLEYSKHSAYIA